MATFRAHRVLRWQHLGVHRVQGADGKVHTPCTGTSMFKAHRVLRWQHFGVHRGWDDDTQFATVFRSGDVWGAPFSGVATLRGTPCPERRREGSHRLTDSTPHDHQALSALRRVPRFYWISGVCRTRRRPSGSLRKGTHQRSATSTLTSTVRRATKVLSPGGNTRGACSNDPDGSGLRRSGVMRQAAVSCTLCVRSRA